MAVFKFSMVNSSSVPKSMTANAINTIIKPSMINSVPIMFNYSESETYLNKHRFI